MTGSAASSLEARRVAGSRVSRRRFLSGAAGALAAWRLVPAAALGRDGAAKPSERVAIGAIGVGGRGMGHVGALLRLAGVHVAAVCDPYTSKREAAKRRVDGHYAGQGRPSNCSSYADFRRLIERGDIDAVVIASPEHWHALHMVGAAKAGKDIYGEKALSLTIAEGRRVCGAVRRYRRVFQVGTQQRSGRNFRFACELARNAYLGAVHTVEVGVPGGRALPNVPPSSPPPDIDYDLWLGPAPYSPYNKLKCTYNWYFIYDYCVGWIQSWGVHHIDTALWGAPSLAAATLKLKGTATFPDDGLANTSITWRVECTTPDGVRLSFSDNGHHQQGCRFEGDKGWVHVNRGGIRAQPQALLSTVIKPDDQHLYESNHHMADFLDCVRTRRDPVAPVETGHAATTLTILADIATRLRRELTWDWRTESFVDDEAADRMRWRPMRSPWSL